MIVTAAKKKDVVVDMLKSIVFILVASAMMAGSNYLGYREAQKVYMANWGAWIAYNACLNKKTGPKGTIGLSVDEFVECHNAGVKVRDWVNGK